MSRLPKSLDRDTGVDGTGGKRRVFRHEAHDDVRHRLHELRPPTLFLAADHDHLVPSVAQARFMATRVHGSTLRVLKGHGHICLIAPDMDLEALLDEWRAAA